MCECETGVCVSQVCVFEGVCDRCVEQVCVCVYRCVDDCVCLYVCVTGVLCVTGMCVACVCG